jgi:hypothetical protein
MPKNYVGAFNDIASRSGSPRPWWAVSANTSGVKTTVMCQTKSALNLLVFSLQTNSGVVNYTSQIVQDSGNSDALVVNGRALFVKQWSTV